MRGRTLMAGFLSSDALASLLHRGFGKRHENIFNTFTGSDVQKAIYIFSFVAMISHTILIFPAILVCLGLVGRERTAALVLTFSIVCVAASYASEFAWWVNSSFVNGNLDQRSSNTLIAFDLEFLYLGGSALFCALLFFNNCSFETPQTNYSKPGSPSRVWAMIFSGAWLLAATIFTILFATYTSDSPESHRNARDVFYILEHLIRLPLAFYVLKCTWTRIQATPGPGYQMHQSLRWVTTPLLLTFAISALGTGVAYLVNNRKIEKTSDPIALVILQTIADQIDLAGTLLYGIIYFLVSLIGIGAAGAIIHERRAAAREAGRFHRMDPVDDQPTI